MKIVKNLVEEDIILSNHKLSDKEIIRAYSVLVKKLYKQIIDLEIDNDLLIKDLEIYNKALKLACETCCSQEIDDGDYFEVVEYWKIQNDKYLDILGVDGEILFEYFLQRAKEKIDEEISNNCSC